MAYQSMQDPNCQQQQQYPPQQGGYPPQQQQYPPQQGGYPPQQGGYPPQQPGQPYGQPVVGSPAVLVAAVPPGAPPGGYWITDKYCGMITILIGIFLLPCICCCPIDSRQVYVATDGRKFLATGEMVQ